MRYGQYKYAYLQLTTGVPTFLLAHNFRTIIKNLSSYRMHNALLACDLFTQLPRERMVTILYECDVPEDVRRYTACLLDYFNRSDLCEFHVITDKCSTSSQRIPAIKHGIRDVEAPIGTDVKIVSQKLAVTKSLRDQQQAVIGKYETINSATKLFLEILARMYLK